MKKLIPLNDKIIIKQMEEEEKTKSGIYLASSAKEKPSIGEVIAVGPGKKTSDGKVIPMDVKIGDKVAYSKYAPTELKIDGEEYLVISESDILCIIK